MTGLLCVFDVRVYLLSMEMYYAERGRFIEAKMDGADPAEIAARKAFYERNADRAIGFRDYLEKSYGGP